MKRLKYLILGLLIILIPCKVFAKEFNLKLDGSKEISVGSEINIELKIENAKDIWGLSAPLIYDKEKLEFVSATGYNGFTATVRKSIVLDNSKGMDGNYLLAILKFKVLDKFKSGEKSIIKIDDPTGSDGDTTFNGKGSQIELISSYKSNNTFLKSLSVDKYTIKFDKNKNEYDLTVDNNVQAITINAQTELSTSKIEGTGVKELKLYKNIFDIVVIAENGSKNTYRINVFRKDSNNEIIDYSTDNYLDNLAIDKYNIVFNKDTLEYTIILKNNTKELNINAEASSSKATVTIDKTNNFKYGNNIIKIKVISESNEERTYIINAIKLEKEKLDIKNIIIIAESILIVVLILLIIFIKLHKR